MTITENRITTTVSGTAITTTVTEQPIAVTLRDGVADHGLLTGLGDDDHPQYYTAGRLATVLLDYATAGNLQAHTSRTDNPHSVTAAQVGADPAGTAAAAVTAHLGASDPHSQYYTAGRLATVLADYATASSLQAHTGRTDNPHSVTAAQVGAYSTGQVDTLLAAKVPTSRQITINGDTQSLAGDATWTIAAGVTGVTASAPLASSGGATPNLSLAGTVAPGNGGTGTANSGALTWPSGGGTAALLAALNTFSARQEITGSDVNLGVGAKAYSARLAVKGQSGTRTLTGTITHTSSGLTVTGTGTVFTAELEVGDIIASAASATQTRFVTAIASDTSLTISYGFNAAGTDVGASVTRVPFRVADSTGAIRMLVQHDGGLVLGGLPPYPTTDFQSNKSFIVTGSSNYLAVYNTSNAFKHNSGTNGLIISSYYGIDFQTTYQSIWQMATYTTNAIDPIHTFRSRSNGTVATGFGARLLWQLESSSTNDRDAAALDVVWTDATDAMRTSDLVFSTTKNGTLAERLRITGAGNTLAKAGTDTTVALSARRYSGTATADIFQAQDETGGVLGYISADGRWVQTPTLAGTLAGLSTSVISSYDGGSTTYGVQASITGNGVSGNQRYVGLAGTARSGTGTRNAANLTGFSGSAEWRASSGTVTDAVGMSARVSTFSNGGVTNAYAIRALNTIRESGSAVISVNYGLYVDDQTIGLTNYAIYTNAGPVRLGGDLIHAGSKAGFLGASATPRESVAADATDLASAITLINDLKAKLITKGLVA